MKPKFETDREGCGDRYLGTYLGCDLYVTTNDDNHPLGPSLIVRHGNEGHEYGSMSMSLFRESLLAGGNIGGEDFHMPYREWIISDRQNTTSRVMLLGLALIDAEKASGKPIHG